MSLHSEQAKLDISSVSKWWKIYSGALAFTHLYAVWIPFCLQYISRVWKQNGLQRRVICEQFNELEPV